MSVQAPTPAPKAAGEPFELEGRFEMPERCPACGVPLSGAGFPHHITASAECREAFGGQA